MGRGREKRLGQGGGAEGGAVGLDGPPGGAGEGGEDVVHVGAGGEGEVAVLPQPGQHAAGDGAPVPLPQLGPLLLPLAAPPRRGGGGGGGEAARASARRRGRRRRGIGGLVGVLRGHGAPPGADLRARVGRGAAAACR